MGGVGKPCHYAAIITSIILCICGTPLFITGVVYISLGGQETEYRRYLYMIGLILMLIGIVLMAGGITLIVLLCCTDLLSIEGRRLTPEPPKEPLENGDVEVEKPPPRTIITYDKKPRRTKHPIRDERSPSPDQSAFPRCISASFPHKPYPGVHTPRTPGERSETSTIETETTEGCCEPPKHYQDFRNNPSDYSRPTTPIHTYRSHSNRSPRRHRSKVKPHSHYVPSFSRQESPERPASENNIYTYRKIPAHREKPYFWDSAPFYTSRR